MSPLRLYERQQSLATDGMNTHTGSIVSRGKNIEKGGTSMKTVRIREKIKAFLAERPRNTAEILEHINSTMRHGTTSQQLGNVLSKDKDIVKVGYIKRSGILSGGYDICEWATRIWVSDNYPEWDGEGPILMDRDRR
tara:strand:- start:1010 stop:1420 length:411 start_codon:yes stop_codon:yes gene_type:complete